MGLGVGRSPGMEPGSVVAVGSRGWAGPCWGTQGGPSYVHRCLFACLYVWDPLVGDCEAHVERGALPGAPAL